MLDSHEDCFDGDVSQPLGSPEYRRTRRLGDSDTRHEQFPTRQKLPQPFRLSDVTPHPSYVHPDMFGMSENLRLAIHGFQNVSEPSSSVASTPFAEATNVVPPQDRHTFRLSANS